MKIAQRNWQELAQRVIAGQEVTRKEALAITQAPDEEAVEIAFSLRQLDADSIPCNFLNAIDGTPLEGRAELHPRKCLKLLAMMRFVNPSKEIRIAGGREVNLGALQPLGLHAANSIFVGDYLTTEGQEVQADWKIIEDLGFEIEECTLSGGN